MIEDHNLKIPTALFDGAPLSPAERMAGWNALTPGYDNVLPEGADLADFAINCRGWLLDDLVITANYATPTELVRTAAHIADYSRDTYTLVMLKWGEWWAELDYGNINVGAGQVCIMDFTVPWHVHGSEQENVMLVIPKAVVAAMAPDAPRLHGRLLEGASGRLFAENMLALTRHLPDLNQADARLVRDATLALLASALHALSPAPLPHTAHPIGAGGVHRQGPHLHRSQPHQSRSWRRPDLPRARGHPARPFIAPLARHRASSATSSNAGSRPRNGRLADGQQAATMTEIAAEFCFSSAAHFSTAFRRRYGYTPRDAKDTHTKSAGTNQLFQSWVDILGFSG